MNENEKVLAYGRRLFVVVSMGFFGFVDLGVLGSPLPVGLKVPITVLGLILAVKIAVNALSARIIVSPSHIIIEGYIFRVDVPSSEVSRVDLVGRVTIDTAKLVIIPGGEGFIQLRGFGVSKKFKTRKKSFRMDGLNQKKRSDVAHALNDYIKA